MRHAIIGAGNLGLDIAGEVRRWLPSAVVEVHSRSSGFELSNFSDVGALLASRPTHVWVCCGGGSINEARRHFDDAHFLHVMAPLFVLANAHPQTFVTLFSSDHAADELSPARPDRVNPQPLSAFARLKVEMEDRVMRSGRARTAVVRIGSLYGYHKPQETLPGKILAGFGFNNGRLRLPLNSVTPTPSLWAAAQMIYRLDRLFNDYGPMRHHLAPGGSVTVRDWAAIILERLRLSSAFEPDGYYEPDRPSVSAIGYSLGPAQEHWYEFWKRYFYRPRFTPKAFLPQLIEADKGTLAYS